MTIVQSVILVDAWKTILQRSNIVSYLLVVTEGSELSEVGVSILDSKYPFNLSPRGEIIPWITPLSSLEYGMYYLQIIIGLKS